MSVDSKQILSDSSRNHRYPTSHWNELSRFITGDERDPKNLFYLASDVWDAWQYAAHGAPSQPGYYRFHFANLHSFLKPYVKWHCYQRLLACNDVLSAYTIAIPNVLKRADTYLIDHHCESCDDIALESDFRALWNAQLLPLKNNDAAAFRDRVRVQTHSRSFWKHLRMHFGFPRVIFPVAPHEKKRPGESALDTHQVIPMPVISQFFNKLALHREAREKLNRFHHLRLCVLILNFALGRRIGEVLTAPRGTGPQGPLVYYPARGSGPKGALWFQFSPNKHGPQNRVYVSGKWEDIVTYCVTELIRYGDEVRDAAPVEEREFLILISHWNLTCGPSAIRAFPRENIDEFRSSRKYKGGPPESQIQKDARVLSYDAFQHWLHGTHGELGILERWNITADGSADGEIYRLRTHQARHTRQSAIASDPKVPILSRQRDLNHTDRNMQSHYQHNAREQNMILLEKAKNGELVGPATDWFSTLFGTDYQDSERKPRFRSGQPKPIPPRWRNLIQNNPQFMQPNRVSCGYCWLPQGPAACDDYLNCTTAEDGGCRWFATDPQNAEMLIQITKTVRAHQQQEQESIRSGHEVQAEQHGILSRRAEALEIEALSRCDLEALPESSQDLKERLKTRLQEIQEKGPDT
ncbi:MAG TPA: hypothetical protein VFA09_24720 [Ktedonobacteraceae bacterium]|nr:hypothetical protein [Ktedonobacteraceae bacterium]